MTSSLACAFSGFILSQYIGSDWSRPARTSTWPHDRLLSHPSARAPYPQSRRQDNQEPIEPTIEYKDRYSGVLSQIARQHTMLGLDLNCSARSRCAGLARTGPYTKRDAHQAMPIIRGAIVPCFFPRTRKTAAASSQISSPLTSFGWQPRHHKGPEDQQWVFWSISKLSAASISESACSSASMAFRCSVSFGMHQRVYEPAYSLISLRRQRGSGRKVAILGNGTPELLYGLQLAPSSPATAAPLCPPFERGLGETCLGEVMRHQLRLDRRRGGEIAEQCLGDAAVQNLTPALEQILISRV